MASNEKVEVDVQEWMLITSYIKDKIPETFDIGNAPDEAKKDYTEVLQVVNSYGPAEASTAAIDQGVAAPGA